VQNHNIKLRIFLIILILLPVFVVADEVGDDNFVYSFHLYYSNDQLFADRDFEFNYDVVPEKYTPESFNTQFPFRGEIINFKNEVASEFLFDPRRGNPSFLEGKIKVKAQYVPDGQKVNFYDSQGNQLLTIFVSESSFCNDDGTCNFDKGEDEKTCPNDCTGVTPPLPPTLDEDGLSDTSQIILSILVLVLVGVGGWYTWRRWRKVKDSGSNPAPPIQENDFTNKLG